MHLKRFLIKKNNFPLYQVVLYVFASVPLFSTNHTGE